MPSIADPEVLSQLIARLDALHPDSSRRWGSMTPGEMLCHVGDAAAGVLRRPGGSPGKRKPVVKWLALYTSIPWPKGRKTLPQIDPRAGGTRPGDFEADRRRAVEALRTIASAPDTAFPASHFLFGTMTARDWHHWAFRHTDHHLRQFGL